MLDQNDRVRGSDFKPLLAGLGEPQAVRHRFLQNPEQLEKLDTDDLLYQALERLILGQYPELQDDPKQVQELQQQYLQEFREWLVLDQVAESITTEVESAGRERLQSVLNSLPFPHFEGVPGNPLQVWKIDEDGTRTRGHFVNRQFQAITE